MSSVRLIHSDSTSPPPSAIPPFRPPVRLRTWPGFHMGLYIYKLSIHDLIANNILYIYYVNLYNIRTISEKRASSGVVLVVTQTPVWHRPNRSTQKWDRTTSGMYVCIYVGAFLYVYVSCITTLVWEAKLETVILVIIIILVIRRCASRTRPSWKRSG